MSAHASNRRLAGDYPDLRAVVFALRRGWWAIVLCGLGFAAVAAVVGSRAEVRYEASASVLVGRPVADLASLRAAGDRAPTYGNLAGSRRVVAAARARLGASRERRAAAPGGDREDGRRKPPADDHRTGDHRRRRGAAGQRDRNGARPTVLRDARTAARELRHVDPAVAPRHPIASHQHVLTAFAALAGALAGLTLVLLVEYFRGRVTTAVELAEVSGAPMLATLQTGRATAGFDVLAARIALAGGGTAPRSVLVTGDCAPTVADGLADAIARSGDPVDRVGLDAREMPASVLAAVRRLMDRPVVLDAPAPDRFLLR